VSARELVPKLLLTTGALFTVAGIGLLIAGETVIGVVLAAVGVTDLATAPLIGSRMGAAGRRAEREQVASADAGVSPEANPSENPYARED
jgi:hypothetical protein